MDSVMENYTYLGVGRDDGKLAGEFAPVFYDSTRVKLLSANTIWLSETSDTVSIGWDAALPRICSYGFFDKSSIVLFNNSSLSELIVYFLLFFTLIKNKESSLTKS